MLSNNNIKSLGVFILLVTFFSCKTMVKYTDEQPYNTLNAWVQQWHGGVRGSGQGVLVHIEAKPSTTAITPDSVFYNGQKEKVTIVSKKENTLVLEANLRKFNNEEQQISHGTSSLSDTDSIAKKGELVFSFYKNNKLNYYKIKDFKQKKPLFYAAAKPH